MGSGSFLVGVEFFNSDFEKVVGDTLSYIYSDYLGMNYKYITPADSSWNNYVMSVRSRALNNEEISYVSIHFLNSWKTDDDFTAIDNVSLKKSSISPNLINDGQFNLNYLTSPWEASAHDMLRGSGKHYLHKNREPILNSLNNARNSVIAGNINLPSTKIILMLPVVNIEHYEQVGWSVLYNDVSQYYTTIENKFNAWKIANNSPDIEIAGVYFSDESMNGEKAIKLKPFLNYINSLNRSRGWKLFGSPYNLLRDDTDNCKTASSYSEEMNSYFDVLWQQPNAFTNHWDLERQDSIFLKSDVDQEVIRKVTKFSIPAKMGFNMKTVPEDDPHNRINDYFSYGEKYGF